MIHHKGASTVGNSWHEKPVLRSFVQWPSLVVSPYISQEAGPAGPAAKFETSSATNATSGPETPAILSIYFGVGSLGALEQRFQGMASMKPTAYIRIQGLQHPCHVKHRKALFGKVFAFQLRHSAICALKWVFLRAASCSRKDRTAGLKLF